MIDTTDIRTRLDSQGWAGMHPVDIIQLCDEIDRLRGEKQTPPQGETVEAEAFYAIDIDGFYKIVGMCGDSDTQERCRQRACGGVAFANGPVGVGRIVVNLPLPKDVDVAVIAQVEKE